MGVERGGLRSGLGGVAVLCVWLACPIGATDASGVESLTRLKTGNATFVSTPDAPLPVDAAKRTALAAGQTPFAAIFSCADSRVAPEIIFHTGLGDLFVVRSAGEVTDRAVLASIEYGVEKLHIPLVVVLGHESCGAVKDTMATPAAQSLGPNLDYLLKAIRPSVAATASTPAADRLRAAILRNVEESVNDLAMKSAILRHAWESRALTVVGAYYELASGRVHFSEPAAPPPGK